jgi:flavodoxin
MKVLVVYDSIFGNTEIIAQAIGNQFGTQSDAVTVRVGDVKPEQLTGLELLIVGSPTHAFRPTPAAITFLMNIPLNGLQGVKVAAFDTRIPVNETKNPLLIVLVKIFGYAAKPIAERLKKCGGEQVMPPEGFLVKASEGPLKEGELERAAGWGRQIGAAAL